MHPPLPIQRRSNSNVNADDNGGDDVEMKDIGSSSSFKKTDRRPLLPSESKSSQKLKIVLGLSSLFLLFFFSNRHGLFVTHRSTGLWILIALLSIPILSTMRIAFRGVRRVITPRPVTNPDRPRDSYKINNDRTSDRLIAFAFVSSILSNQFPKFVSSLLAATSLALFGLSTRPSPPSRHLRDSQTCPSPETVQSDGRNKVRTVFAAILMISILLVENFFVWVVSATYYPSHTSDPTPLQDNGRMVLSFFMKRMGVTLGDMGFLRRTLNIQWALVSALAGSFVACELGYAKRTLWGVAIRALMTMSVVRFVRTISFLLTVLPSQLSGCYLKHFPPPPGRWMDWFLVGILPNTRGGCNDLIISGHSVVTSVLCCASTSVANNPIFSLSVWTLLAFDYCVEILQGYHYSIDMWLGAILTSLVWRATLPLEETHTHIKSADFQPLLNADSATVMKYSLPAAMAFFVVTVSPESVANVWILFYVVWTAVIVKTNGGQITPYAQHVLLCTLYIGLGVYL